MNTVTAGAGIAPVSKQKKIMCAIVSEHEHLSLWIVNENTSKRFGRSQGMNEKPGQTSDNIRYQDVFFTAVA